MGAAPGYHHGGAAVGTGGGGTTSHFVSTPASHVSQLWVAWSRRDTVEAAAALHGWQLAAGGGGGDRVCIRQSLHEFQWEKALTCFPEFICLLKDTTPLSVQYKLFAHKLNSFLLRY